MKSLRNVAKVLKKVRNNQPKVTLAEAQAQARRIKDAADNAGAKSGPPVIIPRERWEDLVKACVNAENKVEYLQEELEKASAEISDKTENYIRYYNESNCLTAEMNSIKAAHTRVLADRESRIATLLNDLEVTEGNRKYACEHVTKQNELIRDVGNALQALRAENDKLTAEKVNAEHLAKKVIQLQEELVKMDSYKCPFQKTKNNTIHIPCGKCVGCKLEAAYGIIDRSTENVKHLEGKLRKSEEQLQFITAVLDQTSKNLAKSNDDKDASAKLYSKMLAESNALATALHNEKGHLKVIIGVQEKALQAIAKWGAFFRKAISRAALKVVSDYREENSLL